MENKKQKQKNFVMITTFVCCEADNYVLQWLKDRGSWELEQNINKHGECLLILAYCNDVRISTYKRIGFLKMIAVLRDKDRKKYSRKVGLHEG